MENIGGLVMKTYKEMKAELKTLRKDIRYFNEKFYATFVEDYRKAIKNSIDGIDAEEFKETKQTDFYNKNSGAYCVFLELFFSEWNLQKFICNYYTDARKNCVKHVCMYAENEEIMKAVALAGMEAPFKIVEVSRAA